jgi:hypothetical protein
VAQSLIITLKEEAAEFKKPVMGMDGGMDELQQVAGICLIYTLSIEY